MESMFSPDGVIFRWMNKFANLVFLNVLWILCSIPLVTAGAATTAMYSVLLKMVRDEESYVIKGFFHSFVQNFRQAAVIWLLFFVYGIVILGELFFCVHVPGAKWLLIPIIWFAAIGMVTLVFVFPVLAFYKDSVKNILKNSFLMAIVNLPKTVFMMMINGIPLFVLWFFSSFLNIATFFDIVIAFALSAWINARYFRNIFEKYLPGEGNSEKQCEIQK